MPHKHHPIKSPRQQLKPVVFYFRFTDEQRNFWYATDSRRAGRDKRPIADVPAWTRLLYHQCSCCTLSSETEFCPTALTLRELLTHFAGSEASERVSLRKLIGAEEHRIVTDLRRALAFVIPVVLARSACPHAHLLEGLCTTGHMPDTLDRAHG